MDPEVVKSALAHLRDLKHTDRQVYLRALERIDPGVWGEVARLLPHVAPATLAELPGYEVIGILGEGGMGRVYLARDRPSGDLCAVKVLPGDAWRRPDLPMTDLLRQEGIAQGRVDHPNVVQLLRAEEASGRPMLVMEFIDGPDLDRLLRELRHAGRPLALAEIDALGQQILRGVAAAHDLGLVHRDLKPSNVLIAIVGDRLVPKIADFGLARVLDHEPRSQPGVVTRLGAGTRRYQPPEQRDGQAPCPAMDVFALGAVLFELIEGAPAFVEDGAWERTVQTGRAPPIHRRGVPDRMLCAVRAGLSLAHRRPADASALLALWLGDAPAEAATAFQPEILRVARRGAPGPARARRGRTNPRGWGSSRRVFVVGAVGDRHSVENEVPRLRLHGHRVLCVPLDPPATPELDAASRAAIAWADQVQLLWSVRARRDDRVEQICAHLRGKAADGVVEARSLDGTPLPDVAEPRPDTRVFWSIWAPGSVLLAAAAIVHAWRTPWYGGLTWLGLWGALVLSLAVVGLQWMRRPDLLLGAARVHTAGAWLRRAEVHQLLALAEEVLDWLFGPKIVSWRSLQVSALISSLSVLPLALNWSVLFALGALELGKTEALAITVVSGLGSLLLSLPLALGNVAFDYLSLLVTRTVLRRLIRPPSLRLRWLVLGLGLDAVVVVACALCTVCTNVLFFGFYALTSGAWLAWPRIVLTTLALLCSGGLDPSNALRDILIAPVLISGVAMGTATLPSLVHSALLALGLAERLGGRGPIRLLGSFLQRVADAHRGPWTLLLPLAVIGLIALGAAAQTPLGPPEGLVQWRTIEMDRCGEPCLLGCPPDEAWCDVNEHRREVWPLPDDVQLLRTEVPQGLWRSVWDGARREAPHLGQFGLRRHPSVFRGEDLPVDSVSWCDALRFANLWTALDALTTESDLRPVYCLGEGCDRRGRSLHDPSHALPDCEARSLQVRWDRSARGYRLPTDVEWEIAARGGTASAWWTGADEQALLASEWLNPNADWRPHPVDALPRPSAASTHPFDLLGTGGNVSEWTWDRFVAVEGSPPEGRQVFPFLLGSERHIAGWAMDQFDPTSGDGLARVTRGGSWYAPPRAARSASRIGLFSGFRFHAQGFRLVRPDPE